MFFNSTIIIFSFVFNKQNIEKMKKIVAIIGLAFSMTGMAFSQSQTVPYKISEITAFLYYNGNKNLKDENIAGTMSENIIDNETLALWNTIIGAGDAKGISNQTFVVVKIIGNPKEYISRNVRLTVMKDKKVFFKQTQEFAILDQNSKYYAAFLLYDTGCGEITLIAEISNNKIVESKLAKTIPFRCGE